jgi:hypothetical protein
MSVSPDSVERFPKPAGFWESRYYYQNNAFLKNRKYLSLFQNPVGFVKNQGRNRGEYAPVLPPVNAPGASRARDWRGV